MGFRQQLEADGLITLPDTTLESLTGGVSSDIYRVNDGDRVFVVKRALPQLRVAAEWHADIRRNQHEVAYLNHVRRIAPENVPTVLHHNETGGYFAMEHLGRSFRNWKTELLAGRCDVSQAQIAGALLGRIHSETWDDPGLEAEFDTTANFHDLRLEPYLLATGERHPELQSALAAESNRIRKSRQCLVHGDYSPKNLMFEGNRLVVLDCEVAWFGDAAFDIGFLLNHLTIKALHLAAHRGECLQMAEAAWQAYANEINRTEIERPLTRLLPMLMLARVDGKSPVEYLSEEARESIRRFTTEAIQQPAENLIDLWSRWQLFLNAHANR